MDMAISEHAGIRMQQRGIAPGVLDCLWDFGEVLHDGHGACILSFSGKSRVRLRKTLGPRAYSRLEPKLHAYDVVSCDGHIITVGYRRRRITAP